MCLAFGMDIGVGDSKVGSLFLLDSTAVENEILTPQNDMQMKSKASAHIKGEFWHLLSEERGVVCQPCLA